MNIAEQVYETLSNALEPEHCVPWVEPIFLPGNPCYETYCGMLSAYEQLRLRTGTKDEDADAEEMINCLLKYGKILALEMFRYGYLYRDMKEKEK